MKRVMTRQIVLTALGYVVGLGLYIDSANAFNDTTQANSNTAVAGASTSTGVSTGVTIGGASTFVAAPPLPRQPALTPGFGEPFQRNEGRVWTQHSPCPGGFSQTILDPFGPAAQPRTYECAGK